MDKNYEPQSIESDWYQNWEKQGYFAPGPGKGGYCIALPPPLKEKKFQTDYLILDGKCSYGSWTLTSTFSTTYELRFVHFCPFLKIISDTDKPSF